MTKKHPLPADRAMPGLEAATLAYLHHLGRVLVAADLWVGLPQGDGDGLPMALLPRAISRFGLQLRHAKGQRVAQIGPPCLVVQKDGGVVFVRSSDANGDHFAVLDPAKGAEPQQIGRADLAALSAGEVVHFIPETEALTEKHAGTSARRHWFWGHFGVIKARIFDVVLASAFANILAITVSLFALQVYDRVVPNQNEATLWVLASGAAAAIVMEFFLRVSRAMLIDRAGRDIEIAVNRDLFHRLIDMRLDRRPMPPGALVNTMREFSSVKEFFRRLGGGGCHRFALCAGVFAGDLRHQRPLGGHRGRGRGADGVFGAGVSGAYAAPV
jgi:ATP-binding cassette subfamily C protein LapB